MAPQYFFDHIFLDRGHVQSWQRTRPAEISRSLAMVATYEYAPKYEDAEGGKRAVMGLELLWAVCGLKG